MKHVYECKVCKKRHEDKVKALECCAPMSVPSQPCFACPVCEGLHFNENDAAACCGIDEQDGYVCDNCKIIHDSERSAKWCRCRVKSIFICSTCSKEHTNILDAQTCHIIEEVKE